MKIGNVKLENNVFLAPMAGITDLPFRTICKKFGPSLVYTEMISSKALLYGDEKTKQLLQSSNFEKPVAVQIFGRDLEAIEYSVKYLNNIADIIDINMGCPAPKVTKNGEGSKLLLDLELIENIIKTAVSCANVPITIKIRKGWDQEHIVAVQVAQIAERLGISAITVHGRTRSEFFSGEADWNIIKEVKDAVNIPVIANGDIRCAEDAKKILSVTGADGIMVGRASIGNPWIFREILSYLQTGKTISGPSSQEKLQIILEHINLACQFKREEVAVREMRKHLSAYLKGMPNASELRNKINQMTSRKEIENELNHFWLYHMK